MPGARSARGLVCKVESTRVSHHGHAGNTRHSPRNGFTVSFALSPVTGLVCHRHRQSCFCQLDTSVGASGPHDFAVRKPAPSSEAPLASTASRLTFVTIAKRPSERRDDGDMRLIWVRREMENFLMWDWTTQITLIRFNKIAFCVNLGQYSIFERKAALHLISGPLSPGL
jgi:hypothetical protein